MKKSISAIAICLGATASWALDDTDAQKKIVRKAVVQKTEKESLLFYVAVGASQFARDAGCAPGAPADLVGKPSRDRLRVLGCKQGEGQVSSEYLPPSLRDAAKRLTFVRRWDGLMVIEYAKEDGSKDQCTFLDAEHSKCDLGWPE